MRRCGKFTHLYPDLRDKFRTLTIRRSAAYTLRDTSIGAFPVEGWTVGDVNVGHIARRTRSAVVAGRESTMSCLSRIRLAAFALMVSLATIAPTAIGSPTRGQGSDDRTPGADVLALPQPASLAELYLRAASDHSSALPSISAPENSQTAFHIPADSQSPTSVLVNTPTTIAQSVLPADEPKQDLVVPIPVVGAAWTLLIGAGMYHYGSRAMRLRR
jgi:hypothetical protein